MVLIKFCTINLSLSKFAYLFVCTGLSFWNKEEKKGREEIKEGEKERKELVLINMLLSSKNLFVFCCEKKKTLILNDNHI